MCSMLFSRLRSCVELSDSLSLQVMKFWAKAERVVSYKIKTVADARKKEAMDKHLSFLVDQTQRYSSLLAERLHTGAHFGAFKLSDAYELLLPTIIRQNNERLDALTVLVNNLLDVPACRGTEWSHCPGIPVQPHEMGTLRSRVKYG